MSCVARVDTTDDKGNWIKIKCGNPTEPGMRYCDDHKGRKWAIKERENQSLETVIEAASAFTPQFAENNTPVGAEVEQKTENHPVQVKNIFEKTMDVLDKSLLWEEKTWDLLMGLAPYEMRYLDKAGAEQQHSFVGMNERAQDRTIRAVTAIAKLDIDAQSVNVNRMMRDLIKNVVVKAMTQAGLSPDQINQVRLLIAEEFARISQESTTKEE